MKLDVAILGASGYGGGELLRWLSIHPKVASLRGTARTLAGQPFWKAHPNLRGVLDGGFEEELDWTAFAGCEQPVVFSALAHGALAEKLPELESAWQAAGIAERLLLVDLSGDFRLQDPAVFAKAYKKAHPCPGQLPRFVYGMPEWNKARIPGARRIANPGCFATALQLGVVPLRGLKLGFLAASAATGSSGSGASPSEGTHHPLRAQDFRAYKVLAHQHLPEVHMAMEACAVEGDLAFVPQSAPMVRGIFATLMFPLPGDLDAKALQARAQVAFQDCPFVRLVEDSPRVTAVAGSNFADLSVAAKGGAGVVLVALDNLCKGMASQAVQNMNLALGLPETEGLRIAGRYPA
ncbi:MAG TPA: N-acetyl-gamma-glutamyl-phosphate reductase [Holophaga sp.]|nr:N-acetyl-gamma-glutamyl-phosphate reductase [Holophaga sp.]HPS66383.1 N-acetyl-gamma-glutamyl-phosphate reductase [Holophaga sp.]